MSQREDDSRTESISIQAGCRIGHQRLRNVSIDRGVMQDLELDDPF
jgi:hypothetical protein